MNKARIVLAIAAVLCALTCAAQTKPNNQEREDFFEFFQVFCQDSAFQLTRIRFPLTETYLSSNLDTVITRRIRKDEWKFIQIKEFKSNTFEYYFDSFSNRKLPDSDEMVYAIIGVENGIQVNYYFKRENYQWFLVKVEDLST